MYGLMGLDELINLLSKLPPGHIDKHAYIQMHIYVHTLNLLIYRFVMNRKITFNLPARGIPE